MEFFNVITPDGFVELLAGFPRLAGEAVPLDGALGRRLAGEVAAREDLPEGARSTVDGYAVRAEDTFGASDAIPALLKLAPAVTMGTVPGFKLAPGHAAPIPTGGFLPQGADAVVMVEYANPAGAGAIEVSRPVTLRTNVLGRGEDARAGEALLGAGKLLRAQEIGFLAALGVAEVEAFRRPRVAIVSSGDEVVPVGREPRPGQVRDANGHALAALVRDAGGEPVAFDIVPDDAAALDRTLRAALDAADVVAISGGSSVGARDLMASAVAALPGAEVLAHGVAIRPGKPTLLGRCGGGAGHAVFGLPGHPVSALVVAQVFLAPFLRHLQGAPLRKGPEGREVAAALASSLHSTIGLEEYVRVRLERADVGPGGARGDGETPTAHPVWGKSGMLSTLVRADGVVRVPMNAEGLARGAAVPVILY
ncbi:MAG: molybdopterin molybdotransferase MoeA [Acidobacteriota bacterium]|jgi:molybdopterin molybdotransferase|nr:molybdopterin molybdotransferase MoeA [Acidobacteriota bacterium]